MFRYSLFVNGRYLADGYSPTREAAFAYMAVVLREKGILKGEAKVWPADKNTLDYEWEDVMSDD